MCVKQLLLTATILGSMTFAVAANATPSSKEFVKKVSISNQFEIQSSQLALDKSHDDAIEKFAQRMVDDHTEAAADLANALDTSKVKTSPEDDVDGAHAKMLAKLDKESGAAFNRDYIMMQSKAHHEAVALFADYSEHGGDPALKGFAKQTLPTLKSHLKHVEQLAAKK